MKFELVFNLNTAKQIGITIPQSILLRKRPPQRLLTALQACPGDWGKSVIAELAMRSMQQLAKSVAEFSPRQQG